jgi:hypothetical protein
LWIQSSSTLVDYQPRKRRRVGIVSDDGPRSSHRSRRGNLANLTETLSSSKRPGKETPKSTNPSSVLGSDREHEGKELTGLAWGNLRRRDISTQSEGALDPVLRYAMSQLHGSMVFRIWRDMASNQDLTSRLREESINTVPTFSEGRKVKSKLSILNSINTLQMYDSLSEFRAQMLGKIRDMIPSHYRFSTHEDIGPFVGDLLKDDNFTCADFREASSNINAKR